MGRKKTTSLIPSLKGKNSKNKERAYDLHQRICSFMTACEQEKRREANFTAFILYFHLGRLFVGYEREVKNFFKKQFRFAAKSGTLLH